MKTRFGPTRLVVIRSGKYDYGEIDLTEPVHLVGPNNVGKTSLIALLQLLYVDSQTHMTFSRPLDESKRYYFPDTDSYVLFEVLTPTGFQVVGAHGLGKVKRNDFVRFAYQGRFDVADYLDEERRVREAADVKLRLSEHDYIELQPRHLRAALTGIGDNRGVHLGLVPLDQRDQYERFRAVFQHLLRLAQIRQAELKGLLLEIYRNEFRQHSVDLGREVAEQLHIIRTNQDKIRRLKTLQPEVERLLKAVQERDAARGPLPGLWGHLSLAAAEKKQELARQLAALEEREQLLGGEVARAEDEYARCRDEKSVQLKQSTRLEDFLARLEAEKKRFEGYIPEFKEQERALLDDALAKLTVQIHSGSQETVPQLEKKLRRRQRARAELESRLQGLAGSVGSRIAELLPDPAKRSAFFKLIDTRLLQLPIGEAGLQVSDENGLRAWLAETQGRMSGNHFNGCGVRIDLAALPEPDLDEFLNAERIAEDLAETGREITRLEEALQAARDARQLARQRSQLSQDRDALVREMADWQVYQDEKEAEPRQRAELAEVEKVLDGLEETMERAQARLRDIGLERRDLDNSRADVHRQQTLLNEAVGRLRAPDESWAESTAGETSPEGSVDFDDLAARYSKLYEEQRRHDERVQDQLRIIEEHTYGRYAHPDESVTIDLLRGEMDALPEMEESTDNLWHGLAVGLRSSFKQLRQDLETLKSMVSKLNRQLGAVTVSNLEKVSLVIDERPEWKSRITDMLEIEDMPLFADPVKAEAAIKEIGNLLDKHEKVDLADLFGLQFEVKTVGGRTMHYQNLDSVESNGTTITMKVLINVLMLRELLKKDDVRIPFYLDEASSLDHDNLEAIVQYSQKHGFVPVLASPDPMEAATHLYFVAEQGGRVVLDPEVSKVTLRALDEGPNPGDGPAEKGVI